MQKELNKRILYHFIPSEYLDDKWQKGNDFIIDNSHNSFIKEFETEKPMLTHNNKDLYDLCDLAFDNKLTREQLFDLKTLIQQYLSNQPIALREYIFEKVRITEFPNYISRKHCLFLTDVNSVKHWDCSLNTCEKVLFKLEVSGIAFIGHDCLIPSNELSIEQQEQQARYYWQNKLSMCSNKKYDDREYLFQGHVKVLRKI